MIIRFLSPLYKVMNISIPMMSIKLCVYEHPISFLSFLCSSMYDAYTNTNLIFTLCMHIIHNSYVLCYNRVVRTTSEPSITR